MGLVIPNVQEVEVLTNRLNTPLTLRLYGNNATPTGLSTAASFTEIAGGGYAALPLVFAGWNIVAGDPSIASYNTIQSWTFTGITNAPGTVYGYYITRDSDGLLMLAERFPSGVVPFSPIEGSVIRILPRYSAQSQF